MRAEFEQRLDLVEEAKLQKLDAVQASLNGVWLSKLDGCPHIHKYEDINRCDANEMRPCIYETGDGPCETFEEILEEWRIELEICPECGQVRPGDERVKAGMKCGFCALGYVAGGIGAIPLHESEEHPTFCDMLQEIKEGVREQ